MVGRCLQGRRVIVLGASHGLRYQIASHLLSAGDRRSRQKPITVSMLRTANQVDKSLHFCDAVELASDACCYRVG